MPTFSYNCLHCGHLFDVFKSNSEEVTHCPVCNHDKLERVYSGFNFFNSCSPSFGGG